MKDNETREAERPLILDDTFEIAKLIGELGEQAELRATVTTDIDAFNLAAGLITDTDFPDRLENLIRQNQTDPGLLTLEITDTVALGDSRDSTEILMRLRLKNVNLALDNFGAAGQAINALFTLPVNEIKIDRCVTADLMTEHGAPIVYRGLLDIARQLGVACWKAEIPGRANSSSGG